MSNAERILIIGNGIVGTSAAYHLAKAGAPVTVLGCKPPSPPLQSPPQTAESASAGNAGLISVGHPPLPKPGLTQQGLRWMFRSDAPLYIPPKPNPALIRWLWKFRKACSPKHYRHCMQILAEMGKPAGESFRRIINDEAIDCEYHPVGELNVFRTPAGAQHAKEEHDLMQSLGYHVELWDDDQLRANQPAFREDCLGALMHKERAFAHPGKFMLGLHAATESLGVEFHTASLVTAINHTRGKLTGVTLADGSTIKAQTIILAAGVWSSKIARTAGIKIPMQAGKGYHLMLDAPAPPHPLPTIAGVMMETYVAVTPLENGLRLAGTLEFSGINLKPNSKRANLLIDGANTYLHGLETPRIRTHWCGLRPCTADGLPVLGPTTKFPQLFIATGHAMLGFALGPLSGKIIANLILHTQPPVNPAPLAPSRFN